MLRIWLQRLKESRERQLVYSEVALLDQPDVKAKMLKFHRSIGEIEEPLCLTCLESFLGSTVSSDECSRCHRDSSNPPKLYSDANNMDTRICIQSLIERLLHDNS